MSGTNCCNNKSLYQKSMRALIEHTTDVQFTFENGNDTVKIPASKMALAASSPVFNAMFNGALKEKGDVKITDASPEAFQEFLQLFYDSQVKLTMKNIAEVLKLVDKYDIVDALPLCSDFLKKNVKTGDILWALHLAVQFNLVDLKTFCDQQIHQNYQAILNMIGVQSGRLRVASDNRLSDTEMANIVPHVFAVLKNIISKNIIPNVPKKSDLLSLILVSTEKELGRTVKNNETIEFSLDKTMILARIIFSRVYRLISYYSGYANAAHELTSCSFEMLIEEKLNSNRRAKTLRQQKIVIDANDKEWSQVELQPPIPIQPNYIYAITLKSATNLNNIITHKSIVLNTSIQIAPNVCFTIHPNDRAHSLISQLRFKLD